MTFQARSIGDRAQRLIARPAQSSGKVLASFESVCDLVSGEGQVIALAWDGVRDAPLNILLEHGPAAPPPVDARYRIERDLLIIETAPRLVVRLAGARVWAARPDWRALRAEREKLTAGVTLLRDLLALAAPAESLAWAEPIPLSPFPPGTGEPAPEDPHQRLSPSRSGLLAPRAAGEGLGERFPAYVAAAARAIGAFGAAYGRRDWAALAAAARSLCGLGPGLTPAGDDWLAGWMLSYWLLAPWGEIEAHSMPDTVAVVLAASVGTTTLSRAFLAAAAEGEADANWHDLLRALAQGADDAVLSTARGVMSHGATSGADMLAGFLAGLGMLA